MKILQSIKGIVCFLQILPAESGCNIYDYGANGDGQSLNTKAIVKQISMKTRNFFNLILIATMFTACSTPKPEIISILEKMVVNETGSGEIMSWFDEQDFKATPTTRWSTEGMISFWPAGLVIDLGSKYKITEVWVHDASKEDAAQAGQLSLSSGKPFEWGNPKSVDMQNSNSWVKIDWLAETRFIHLQKIATEQYNKEAEFPENCDLAINEVIIMGYPLDKSRIIEKQSRHVKLNIPMDKFIGMNSYINTPDRVHEAVGLVREYRPWRWNGVTDLKTPINWGDIKGVAGSNEYSQSNMGNSDLYYQKMLDMGVECVPCIHRHVDEANEHENVPTFGGDPNDPFSYKIMADYSFQYVARYGHEKVADNLLRTTEAAPRKSGMGLIRYFENWNEPNRWWGDPAGHFTPYQFAAFCSASYDGHLNQMGPGLGAKNADPNIKFVHGGLAFILPDYLKAMKLWSDHYRNGSFPVDVINVHHYCNTRNEQHPDGEAHGISPEEDNLKEKLARLVQWRNENLPDKEIWLSEFGWDTDENTYISAAVGHKLYPDKITMEEIQAQWLVREFLIGAAAGLDRMMMFLANDLKNYPHGVYGKCGFITVDEEYKPSWYYVKTLKYALTGMLFDKEINSGNENVWIYQFRNPENGRGANVLWCPTTDGTIVEGFELKLSEKVNAATLVSMKDKEEFGVKGKLSISDQKVKVNVSERPVIILVDKL